jgi:diazepam-binding inhibitor (GABA receptor modulator, acyl-CoA-binding protein)
MEESIVREQFEVDFEKASGFVRKNSNIIKDEHKLKLYGLYKLATVGVCNTERPTGLFVSYRKQSMWDSWKDVSEKNIKNPKQMYVDFLTSILPLWG